MTSVKQDNPHPVSPLPQTYRSEEVTRVALVGTGLIGAAWGAWFASRGLRVHAYDPQDGAEGRFREALDEALRDLRHLPNFVEPGPAQVFFFDTLEAALEQVDYVQENAPERIQLKQELIARIDGLLPPDVVIGSSTSSFPASDLQRLCRHPERVVVAHPFNPPHLVPLVEVGAGRDSDRAAQDAAYRFFERTGKKPIRIAREAVGHVANRLSSALWREAVSIVEQGIASVADVDRAVRYGPGLRWAIDGPHMLYHLGGGEGGIAAYIDHLGPAQEARWATLGTPELDSRTRNLLVAGVAAEADGRSIDILKARRDHLLIALLKILESEEFSDD